MEIEMCDAIGYQKDGTPVLLQIPIPPEFKMKEIIRSYFGHDFDDEDSNASMALVVCQEFHEWFVKHEQAIKDSQKE